MQPMIGISLMKNTIQDYAWGSSTAIARLMGLARPSPSPQAELWMGAHPKAPSRVLAAGIWKPLDEVVRSDPDATLGEAVRKRLGDDFPFLLKVLAAETPLSIQAHPDAEQARSGFERENREGIGMDAAHRNYRDPRHKPECLVALTPFWALNGFRSIPETLQHLETLVPVTLRSAAASLRNRPRGEEIRKFFGALMTASETRKKEILAECIPNAQRLAGMNPVCRWVDQLHRHYPSDLGVLAPAFLNLLRLDPGQGMFLEAGRLHAYLEGTGIELMANSDNVLRGGLTPKHVDVDELMRVVHFEPDPPRFLSRRPTSPCEQRYDSPAAEFRLSLIDLTHGVYRIERATGWGPEILFCTDGEIQVHEKATDAGWTVTSGASLFVPDIAGPLDLTGPGTLYRAGVNVDGPRE